MTAEVFGLELVTLQGDRMAIAGFAGEGKSEACSQALGAAEPPVFVSASAYDIDRTASEWLVKYSAPGTLAVGMSVLVRDELAVKDSGGGVLGSIHDEIQSSDNSLELIGENLWLYTRPEGPGVVMQCSQTKAEEVLEGVTALPGLPADERREVLKFRLAQKKISRYIVICDGSGPGSFGYAAAFSPEKTIEFRLF